jgi:large subunit ribosomal protein L16
MLKPNNTKFLKTRKGHLTGYESTIKRTKLCFGTYGIRALTNGRVSSAELEAARRVFVRRMKRTGKLWIRVFPDISVSSKPSETRMGKGKGAISHWITRIRGGVILFEFDGLDSEMAKELARICNSKLSIKTEIIYEQTNTIF